MRLWTKREDCIHDAVNTMTTAILFRPQELARPSEELERRLASMPDPVKRAKKCELLEKGVEAPTVMVALGRLAKLFRDMEKQLQQTRWLAGDDYTLADVGLTSFFHRMDMLHAALWKDRFPEVVAWFDRVSERPSFKTAVRDYIPEAKTAAYARYAPLEQFPSQPGVRSRDGGSVNNGSDLARSRPHNSIVREHIRIPQFPFGECCAPYIAEPRASGGRYLGRPH